MDPQHHHQYNPYQWPPDLLLGHLHARCSMPGKENPNSQQCPCCLRREKLKITNWLNRDLYKDFKYYGGGVSGYFGLLYYYGLAVIFLLILTTFYHIVCLHFACTPQAIQHHQCVKLFTIIKIMSPNDIISILNNTYPGLSNGLSLVNFLTFVFLLIINFATMSYLSKIENRLTKSINIFSHFSLIFKNIPRYMTIAQFKNQLVQIYPQVKIKQIFFLHKTSKYYDSFNKIISNYYEMQYYQMNQNVKQLMAIQPKYIQLYQQFQANKANFNKSTGKAIVVFEDQIAKQYFAKQLHMSQPKLIIHNIGRLLKINKVKEMRMYSDSISQPGQILWRYIGDSSIAKTRVRLETGAISIIFLGICYGLVFYPMDEANIAETPLMGIVWNIVSACGLFILDLIYRYFVLMLAEQRKPNTYLSRSNFIILTTVVFHLLFYLYLPAIYYAYSSTKSSASIKLRTLFFQVTVFVVASVLIATIDLKYVFFQKLSKKHLKNTNISYKLCQKQLHQKLGYPSFPIEYKLMITYKVWSFIVFYAFQIPEIMILILPMMIILYFGDKYRVYTKYKMSSYLPIKLQKNFERVYLYVYFITLSLSYLITATQLWQFCIAPILACSMICLRLLADRKDKKQEEQEQEFQKTQTISNVLRRFSIAGEDQMRQQLIQNDALRLTMATQTERASNSLTIKTHDEFSRSYKESFQKFLKGIRDKKVTDMLERQYVKLKNQYKDQSNRQSEMTNV